VHVPANSPTSVSNTALAWGGGDLTHTNSGNAASGSDTNVPVAQTPASISASGGSGQSTPVNTAFASPLQATVLDAGSQPIPGVTVTFTAPGSGASGTFPGSLLTVTETTNNSGVASSPTFTANSTYGNYTVVASVSGLTPTASFSLTNNPVPAVVSYSVVFGTQTYNLVGAASRTDLPWKVTGISVTFSEAITAASTNSLSGVTATGLSGLGTATLTWTISPLTNGAFSTSLLASGANGIQDAHGTYLGNGTAFSKSFSVLYGDYNADGVVSAADMVLVNAQIGQHNNIFADLNGDGVVNSLDVAVARSQIGATLE